MLIAILSFVGGFLSVLAPCVLPLLPLIVGGDLTNIKDRRRPFIITASLVVSLIIFTLILKISTALIGIRPEVWQIVSGTIVVLLGLSLLFPRVWDELIGRLGLQAKSQLFLGKATKQSGIIQPILTGIALGPVFSSCSPMYAWVVATVLPESTARGAVLLSIYCLGLSVALLLIALFGRKIAGRFSVLSKPEGWFQRIIGTIFILVGVMVATGSQKTLQTYLVNQDFLGLKKLEQRLVPEE